EQLRLEPRAQGPAALEIELPAHVLQHRLQVLGAPARLLQRGRDRGDLLGERGDLKLEARLLRTSLVGALCRRAGGPIGRVPLEEGRHCSQSPCCGGSAPMPSRPGPNLSARLTPIQARTYRAIRRNYFQLRSAGDPEGLEAARFSLYATYS